MNFKTNQKVRNIYGEVATVIRQVGILVITTRGEFHHTKVFAI